MSWSKKTFPSMNWHTHVTMGGWFRDPWFDYFWFESSTDAFWEKAAAIITTWTVTLS